jgi:hypothetical protein
MPTGATGTTISLGAMYPEAPTAPLVAIVDPSSNVLVSGGVPTVGNSLTSYEYSYDIPATGPAGTWTIYWYGEVDGEELGPAGNTFTVTSAAITFPSAECPSSPMWVTTEDYLAVYPDSSYVDAEAAVQEATWLLWSLTNKQYHGIECRQDEYQSRPGLCRIRLAHQPVDEVFVVERIDDCTDEVTEVDSWCSLSGGSVRLCCRAGNPNGLTVPWSEAPASSWLCSCDNGIVRIQYRVSDNLPPGAARVTMRLANEFWKSAHNQKCALPDRITNVTREGVTWITLDPLDFLDKGLTGIGTVDQWLSSVNRRGYATLIDPLTEPRLLTSELTGCGATCGADLIPATFAMAEPAEGEG